MIGSTRYALLMIALITLAAGCNPYEGTQGAAQKHLTTEFNKWISGQSNEVTTLDFRLQSLKEPIGFSVRIVTPASPHSLAYNSTNGVPESFDRFTAYRFNLVIEWRSKTGSPMETVTTYVLTWNPDEKRWYEWF